MEPAVRSEGVAGAFDMMRAAVGSFPLPRTVEAVEYDGAEDAILAGGRIDAGIGAWRVPRRP